MTRIFSVVDLFAGVGGFSEGFLRVNRSEKEFQFALKLLVDSDPTASFTFKRNYARIPYWSADVGKIDGTEILKLVQMRKGELDFLIGGPPCQGFSPNGKRWLEDHRNRLLSRFIELAHNLQPRCVILENVPTALSAFAHLYDEQIHEAFIGYVVRHAVLNASEFGVPQIRRRAFVVALREDLGVTEFDLPEGDYDAMVVGRDSHTDAKADQRFVSVEDAIGDLPALAAGHQFDGGAYPCNWSTAYQRDRREGSVALFNHNARAHSAEFLEKILPIQPGQGNAQLPDGERFSDNYFSQAYARLHPRGIGFTITANFRNPGSGRFTHYRDNRSITVREAARLQSFDDRFIFHGSDRDQERHVGNAVPPLLSAALAWHFGAVLAACETYSHRQRR